MLPLACLVLPSRQCRVLRNLPALAVVARRVALPRRFGRVCWDQAALRRGAGRRVPLPIRIACSTGKFQLMRQFAGTDPHDVERRRGLSHASEESSHRRSARGQLTAFFTLWKLAALRRAAAPASALRNIWQGILACIRGEFHRHCRIDAESTVRIARHRSLMPLP